jgi:hypothetical protein
MERRVFLGASAFGALAAAARRPPVSTERVQAGPGLCLEAIAAAHLPQLAVLYGFEAAAEPPHIFELRRYEAGGVALAPVFERAGIRTLLAEPAGTFLFPFASLEERGRAWNAVAADPEWIRARRLAQLTELALYRTLPRATRAGGPGSAWRPVRLRTR